MHAILEGTVSRVAPFGVFVELDGYSSWGLVHLSNISDYLSFGRDESDDDKISALRDIAPEGHRVWVKVVEIREEPGQRVKVSCSMKLANQRDGADLDPGHSKYRPQGGEKGSGANRGRIGDDAAAVAGGSRIDWGHLAADNARVDGADRYQMVSDEEGGPASEPNGGGGSVPSGVGPSGPRGRGRGSVLPAWMTNQGGGLQGGATPSGGLPQGIETMEQALDIINAYAEDKKRRKKDGKRDEKGVRAMSLA